MQKIRIEEFLALAQQHVVLDVRSPGEYAQAHIPGAYNLPLFTDEERKVVGTAYKQQSRQQAIKEGLDYFGVKMRSMVEEAERICGSKHNTVLVHCWRGGMRSAGVAWLLDLYGFKVCTLAGGYKSFRNWALEQFGKQYPFHVLGGYTGSGKTDMLRQLASSNYSVIDLEGIACHKGSAFGGLGIGAQPTQEMFENGLAMKLWSIAAINDKGLPVWIEDESRRIGDVNIPGPLWDTLRRSPLFFLDIPFEQRLDHIVTHYGTIRKEELVKAIMRIQKRLGTLNAKNAVGYLLEDNYTDSFAILLRYYDKYYGKDLEGRPLPAMICSSIEDIAGHVPDK